MRTESIVSPTVKILTALFLSAAAAVPAQAQQPAANWPARPITIIVPGAPGGTTDVPTRLVAQKLSARLGQPVIVENRPGSGGLIGTQAMVRAPADGYTLLVGNTGTHAVNYSAYKNPGYKSADFYALTDLIYFPNVLVVNAQSPAKTVSELVAQMKKEPGKLTFSSAGIGQTTHLTSELFKMRTETNALHVTYKGATPATTAIVAGETDFMFDNLTQALPHIKSGRLRPLAVTSAERHPGLPDVPTMAQAGFNDFVVMGWLGFFASSQTPPAILAKLQENLIASMQDPEIVSKLQQTGGIPGGRSQASFSAMVNDEIQRWGGLIKKSNLSLD